jgi:hypothetical protein
MPGGDAAALRIVAVAEHDLVAELVSIVPQLGLNVGNGRRRFVSRHAPFYTPSDKRSCP